VKKVRIVFKQHPSGLYTIEINGKTVRNPKSQPCGAATFETKESAQEYLENEPYLLLGD